MQEKNFKKGDYVKLINSNNVFTLEKNKTYCICDLNHKGFIAVDNNFDYYYNPMRFIKDLKKIRKQKLVQIWNLI